LPFVLGDLADLEYGPEYVIRGDVRSGVRLKAEFLEGGGDP
jgi:hypothetical protein